MPRYRKKNDGSRIAIGKHGYVQNGAIITLASLPKGLERFFDVLPDDIAHPASIKPQPPPLKPLPSILPPEDRVTVAPDPQSPDALVIRPSHEEPPPAPTPAALRAAVFDYMNQHSNTTNAAPPEPPAPLADISALSVLVIGTHDDAPSEAISESSSEPDHHESSDEHEDEADELPSDEPPSDQAPSDQDADGQQKGKKKGKKKRNQNRRSQS